MSASSEAACVTIGNFDGVHLGHQSLISLTLSLAAKKGLSSALITFWPHPREILKGKEFHRPLTSRKDKLALLEQTGISRITEIPFTQDFARKSAEEFVSEYLLPAGVKTLVIGHDFSLGRGREGRAEKLIELGREYGFEIAQAPAFSIGGQPVSSTRLRERVMAGHVAEAAKMLGRFHSVSGKVVHGFGRGGDLGFPTANLGGFDTLLPANGVYATIATSNGEKFQSVTNIGYNPTFGNASLSVESFLLNCDRKLYGRELRLEFVDRLRGERKFASTWELVEQIGQDADKAKRILAANGA